MINNEYIPFTSKIKEITRHTDIEYTFRMEYQGDVKPGQFFEISLPKYGEAPISVSGIGEDFIEFTIRKVGTVTDEIFEYASGCLTAIRCVLRRTTTSFFFSVRLLPSWKRTALTTNWPRRISWKFLL